MFILNEMVIVYSIGEIEPRTVQTKQYAREVKYVTTGGKQKTKKVRCNKQGGLYAKYTVNAESLDAAKEKAKEHRRTVNTNRLQSYRTTRLRTPRKKISAKKSIYYADGTHPEGWTAPSRRRHRTTAAVRHSPRILERTQNA